MPETVEMSRIRRVVVAEADVEKAMRAYQRGGSCDPVNAALREQEAARYALSCPNGPILPQRER